MDFRLKGMAFPGLCMGKIFHIESLSTKSFCQRKLLTENILLAELCR